MKPGVYKITNLSNNKIYVGSTKDLKLRWDYHRLRLRANEHHNKHLQAAWNKYGKLLFKFEIIEECSIDKVIEIEQYWIDKLQATDKNIGYNKRKVAHSNIGMPCSEETKKKISDAQKGVPRPYAKGKKPERAAKISAKLKEYHKNNPEYRNSNRAIKIAALEQGRRTRYKLPDDFEVIAIIE